jgi:uncharacterized membrane protein
MVQQVFISFGQVKQCIFHNAKKRVHAHLELHREGQRVYLPALLLTCVTLDCVSSIAFTL